MNKTMNKKTYASFTLTLAAILTQVSGCDPAMLLPLVPAPFTFSPELSTFALDTDIATRNTGILRVDQSEFTINRGTIELDLAKLTAALAQQQEGTSTPQTLKVTAWVDAPDALDTVCTSGDLYGPFTITFDENLVPTAVTPQDVELTAKTIGLLNDGEISFCLELASSFDGSVTVGGVTLNLGGLPNL